MQFELAPSILAADFAHLGDEVAEAERPAQTVHVDVMDGHLCPMLTMGARSSGSLRKVTRLPLDVHLMISNPDFFVDDSRSWDRFIFWSTEGAHDLSFTPSNASRR